jgi:hypothetical protein
MPSEDHPVLGLGPLVAQVRGDGPPRCFRQRHHVFTPALGAAQCDRAGIPVDVVQVQACDLATSQAQIERAAHHGVGAQHRRAALTEGGFELLDLCRLQRLGQRRQLPVRRIRQGANQRMGTVAQRRAPAEVAAQGRDHDAQARWRLVVLGPCGEEAAHVLRRDDRESNGVVAEVLAQQRFDQAQGALAGLRGKPPHLLHVLVIAAQFLAHRCRVRRLGRDGVGGAQHDQQVAQCGAHGGWVTRTRRAAAAGKMVLDELGHEVLAEVSQALAGLLHPHRQVHHRRFAAAHVAGSVAAVQKVVAVCLCVPLQLSAAAGTA